MLPVRRMSTIDLRTILDETLDSALGRVHRPDPQTKVTGGPAGNFRLTAWTGLVLLVLFGVECVTLLSLNDMITAHIVVGGVLVPLAVLKTATTGWRIVRYYTGNANYRAAGPPPLLLRLLGPLVVLGGLAVLGSGLALIPLKNSAFTPFWSVAGQSIDAVTVHKVCFVFWLGVTSLHVLTRFVTALAVARRPSTTRPRVAGERARLAVVSLVTVMGLVSGFAALHFSDAWTDHHVSSHDSVRTD
jgi:hypothetical protein